MRFALPLAAFPMLLGPVLLGPFVLVPFSLGAFAAPPPSEEDCNQNGSPDVADISHGTSLDANADGIPDECQSGLVGPWSPFDCNGNDVLDRFDIALGTSTDCNCNGKPDECEPPTDGPVCVPPGQMEEGPFGGLSKSENPFEEEPSHEPETWICGSSGNGSAGDTVLLRVFNLPPQSGALVVATDVTGDPEAGFAPRLPRERFAGLAPRGAFEVLGAFPVPANGVLSLADVAARTSPGFAAPHRTIRYQVIYVDPLFAGPLGGGLGVSRGYRIAFGR